MRRFDLFALLALLLVAVVWYWRDLFAVAVEQGYESAAAAVDAGTMSIGDALSALFGGSSSSASISAAGGAGMLDKLLAGHFKQEGGNPGDRNVRNNNPGNLKAIPGVTWQGQTGVDAGGFAIFDTVANGNRALKMQYTIEAKRHPNWTFLQFITDFLGGDPESPEVTKEGNPFTYASHLAQAAGITLFTRMKDIVGGSNA